jgi:hypothetical protein
MYPAGYGSESREGCPSVYDASIFVRYSCSDFVCVSCQDMLFLLVLCTPHSLGLKYFTFLRSIDVSWRVIDEYVSRVMHIFIC